MANRKGNALDAGAGVLQWDYQKKKYVWLSKSDANNPDHNKTLKPSPYESHNGRQPLKVYNKKSQVVGHEQLNKKQLLKPAKCLPTEILSVNNHHPLQPQKPDGVSHQKKSEGNAKEPETSEGHPVFASIMAGRLMHLQAALTFWQQNHSSVVSYLLRANDDSVLVSILPILTESIESHSKKAPSISLGACHDLLPKLRDLLSSIYEDYIVASLDMMRAIIKHWWKDFRDAHQGKDELLQSGSTKAVYLAIVSLMEVFEKLSCRKTAAGPKARVILSLLSQM